MSEAIENEVKKSDKGSRVFRLSHAPEGKCSTGVLFEIDDIYEENKDGLLEKKQAREVIQVDIELSDGEFTLQKDHYKGGREFKFVETLLKNGFIEI